MTDLPSAPAPQIDSITLFPNRTEGGKASRNFGDQRFGYVLHGEVSAAYESNIAIQPTNPRADFLFTISPGLAVGWGDFKSELYGPDSFRYRFERYVGKNFIYANYSPSYTWYANNSDESGLHHDVRLNGEWTHQHLTLGVVASYITQNMPEADVGNLVETRRASVALTSRYEYSGKTSMEVNAYYNSLNYNDDNIDWREWRNEDWLNYQISPKIKIGLGGAVAYVTRSVGPSQTYEEGLFRMQYAMTDQLTLALSGGIEFRQTAGGGGDRTFGTFRFDAVWTPFDGSYFYLEGYRHADVSGSFGEEYYVATGAELQYRQRILQRFYFSLVAGYQNADYQASPGSSDFDRNDDLFYIRPGVGFDVAAWLNCELTAEYRKNSSSVAARQFDAKTAVVKFSVLF
ncbi:MAG: hypothetical protein WDN28_10815 [Chthoniobacter sp.]